MKLRPYQEKNIDEIRQAFKRGVKGVLYQAPTGAGKTASTSWMIAKAKENNNGVWFMVHRRELIKQVREAFDRAEIEYGIIAAGFTKNYDQHIQICMVQTIASRLGLLKKPKLVVWDECHRIGANSYKKIYNHLTEAFHIGLSATPWRSDKQGFLEFFQEMVRAPDMAWLIENSFLSKYKIFCPSRVDMTGIKMTGGDYNQKAMQEKMATTSITGDCLEHYQKFCPGKRAIVFSYSVRHSEEIAKHFNDAGIPAMHVDGETPDYLRDKAIEDFKDGRIKVISNCNIFIEGTDCPAIEACFILRPTKSKIVYLQSIGRALRPAPGKEYALIFDHVGVVQDMGLPDDEHEWSLEPRKKNTRAKDVKEKGAQVTICEKCFCACQAHHDICPNCGYVFPIFKKKLEFKEGELQEIDAKSLRRMQKKEVAQATTKAELVAIQKARGYKKGWVWWQMQHKGISV